jgi:hypothetical protein
MPPAQIDRHFKATASMQGDRVLYDFMGAGDLCDLWQFVSWRLVRIGNGDPVQDMWPQSP